MSDTLTPYYADDLVQLYHGDCREITTWLEADVLVTDPPYGVSWDAGGQRVNSHGVVTPPRVVRIAGDKDTRARDVALDLWGKRPAIVFGSWRAPRPPDVRARLLWHKASKNPGLGCNDLPWYPADEEIYILGRGFTAAHPHPGIITTHERRDGSAGATAKIGHPTPKPLVLMEHLIERCPTGIIADPFAGSGSTLIAAKMSGRKTIGVELEERYCEIAAKRLAQDVLPFEETRC